MKKKFTVGGVKYKTVEVTIAYLLLLPAIVAVILLFAAPLIQVIHMSFTNYQLKTGVMKYNALSNYKYLFTDERFCKSLINTLVYTIAKVGIGVILSLIVALLLDTKVPFRKFIRTVHFLPIVVPVAASAMIWLWFYDPGMGPINQILGWLGISPQKWLYSENTALISIIIYSIWNGVGYNAILLLAGLQGISGEYLEAAKLEGASELQIITKIKLPLLSQILSFVIMMEIINSFKGFDIVNVMTPTGGPGYSTALVVNYIYETAFINGRMGRGAAASLLLFIIILVFTFVQRRVSAKYEQAY